MDHTRTRRSNGPAPVDPEAGAAGKAASPVVREALRVVWPLLLGSVITFASSRAGPTGAFIEWLPHFDKIAHFFIFGLLGTLLYRLRAPDRLDLLGGGFVVASATLFGLSDECHQFLRPDRFFEVADILADCLGSATAVLAYRFWPAYRATLEMDLAPGGERKNLRSIFPEAK